MHVLWTPSWYQTPDRPWEGTHFVEQRGILASAGHQVGIVALQYAPRLRPRQPTLQDAGAPVVIGEYPLSIYGAMPSDRVLAERSARAPLDLYEEIAGVPDVIHAHSVFPGAFVAMEAARRWNRPFVLTEHRPSSAGRHTWTPRFRAIRRAVQAASACVSVSAGASAEFAAFYHTVPWGVIALPTPERFFLVPLAGRDPERFVFCTVSDLSANKRVELTLDAFATAFRHVPGSRILVVGGEPARVTELRERARSLGIEAAVEFTGRVPRDEIATVMAQADCFVLASAKESAGAVFGEAQALGIPCIATRTWGGTFMVEPDAGLLVDIDDKAALAQAMTDIAIHPERFDRAAIRARAAQRFSADVFVEAHLVMYEKAIQTGGGPSPAPSTP